MELRVPLAREQIEAANAIHSKLKEWLLTDAALERLGATMPGFDLEASLLKTVAVNSLYGTNIYATRRMAYHVHSVLRRTKLDRAGPELVEKLARVRPGSASERPRAHRSFASKFAHLFIDPTRFPIFDSYALRMLKYHLGPRVPREAARHYPSFVESFDLLVQLVGWKGSRRELDRYLWIAGQYRAWRKNRDAPINRSLAPVFEASSRNLRALAAEARRRTK